MKCSTSLNQPSQLNTYQQYLNSQLCMSRPPLYNSSILNGTLSKCWTYTPHLFLGISYQHSLLFAMVIIINFLFAFPAGKGCLWPTYYFRYRYWYGTWLLNKGNGVTNTVMTKYIKMLSEHISPFDSILTAYAKKI